MSKMNTLSQQIEAEIIDACLSGASTNEEIWLGVKANLNCTYDQFEPILRELLS